VTHEAVLHCGVLGPIEARVDTSPLSLRRMERALLTRLVLADGHALSASQLVNDLWGETPPANPVNALRVIASRLRKALADAADALETVACGYRFAVRSSAVDAIAFDRLVAAGRTAAACGDHEDAASRLRDALDLWRGPALADLIDVPFAAAHAARLDSERLAVIEERNDADLACGRHRHLVGELEALTVQHPLRERLWAQLMIARYRCDRQADALRAYTQLRGMLIDELGIEPCPPLQRLEAAIIRQDPIIDLQPLTA